MEYDNEKKGILLYSGTYRVVKEGNEYVPIIYLKGRKIKLVESTTPDRIFYVKYDRKLLKELQENFSDKADFKEKTIANTHVIKIQGVTHEATMEILDFIRNKGRKTYELSYTNVDYFTVKKFRPYFYIKEEDKAKFQALMKEFLKSVKQDRQLYKYTLKPYKASNGDFIKIVLVDPRKTSSIRDYLEAHGVRTFEADVPFVQRYLIDRNYTIIKPYPKDIVYYDIEVLPTGGSVPDPQKASRPIIAIAYYTGEGEKGIFILPNNIYDEEKLLFEEAKILKRFFDYVENNKRRGRAVTLAGWNSLLFDWPYIVNRVRYLNNFIASYVARQLKKPLYNIFVKTLDKIDVKKMPLPGKYKGQTRDGDHQYVFFAYSKLDEDKLEDAIEEAYPDTLISIRTQKVHEYWDRLNEIKETNLYKKYAIELPLKITNVDVMKLYKKFVNDKLPTYKLDYIAQLEGFEGKVPIDIGQIEQIWRTNPELLVEYNLHDTELVYKIDQKRNLVRQLYSLSEVSGALTDIVHTEKRAISSNKLVDSLVLRIAKEWNRVLPTGRADASVGKKNYSGAHVHTPTKGVLRWVGVLDFNSLYPTIIRAFNIGPDTWKPDNSGDIKAPNGSFVSQPMSILVAAVNVLYDMKMQIKHQLGDYAKKYGTNSPEYRALKARYLAVKGVLNSVYGVTGYPKFRLYKKEVAENITTIGRIVWHKTKEFAEEMGYKVVYGDTDSQYYLLKAQTPEEAVKELEWLAQELTAKIRNWVTEEFNARGEYFDFEPDEVFEVLGLIAKKNYIGYVVYKDGEILDEPDLVYAGIFSRGDVSDAVKKFIFDLADAILKGDRDPWAVVDKWKQEVLEGKWDNEVVIWKSLNKDPDSYKSIQPHVRAYRMLIERGVNPLELTKVGFVKVGDRSTDIRALAPGDKIVLTQTQREYVWRNQFEKKIEVLKPIMPKKKEENKQRSLTDFFS